MAGKSFFITLCALLMTGGLCHADEEKSVDFERHIAPLLGRLGCNSAACHGAFGGKGGLQLSLFGYSSEMDFDALMDRIDPDHPDESLFLRKPSGMKHKGGVKFAQDSETYSTIRQWIEADAPWDPGSGKVKRLEVTPKRLTFDQFSDGKKLPRQLQVVAEFSDGTKEDVTHLTQFTSRDEGLVVVDVEGLVTPVRQGSTSIIVSYSNQYAAIESIIPFSSEVRSSPPEQFNEIDQFINQKLQLLNLPASRISGDEEFLRRLTLDTIGRIPTPDEISNFCSDTDVNKREKKIDELLQHPMHAALWANRMCEITKARVEDVSEGGMRETKQVQWWHAWFRKRFAENMPYDQIARDVVTATSRNATEIRQWLQDEAQLIQAPLESWESTYADREKLDLYWRRTGDDGTGFPTEDMAELTAAAFTGIRINCARCHKHPFDRWSQDDYASFANIFSEVAYGSSSELNTEIFAELDRRREAKKRGEKPRSLPQIREVYNSKDWGKRVSGSSAEADVSPKPLGGSRLNQDSDYRTQFANWLTHKDNPYFAKNFANRVWASYFGVGIVDPVDDFSIANPPSHPELLEMLAKRFAESNFDVRRLEKMILMSAAYQRTSTPSERNQSDRNNFARQYVRPLMAEVVLDSINVALGCDDEFTGLPGGTLAVELGGDQVGGPAQAMLATFGKSQRESVCECDRQVEPDLNQSIFLMIDDLILKKIEQGKIREILKLDDEQLLEQLYLRLLGRAPLASEVEIGLEHLNTQTDRGKAFDDLVWALLNTREFITNH